MPLAKITLQNGQHLTLRPEAPGDLPLLFQLYASTREDELALTGWDAATRALFLQNQFKAQRAGYGNQFPEAEFDIVLLDSVATGRMVVDKTAAEIQLVDIVIAAAARNRGIGSALTRALLAEASGRNRAVRLHVLRHSPAVRLYQRHGFSKIGEHSFYDEMEWRPGALKA